MYQRPEGSFIARERLRTFEAHVGVWVKFGYNLQGMLDLLFIVVAVEFITVVIYEGRVSTNDSTLVAGVVYDLCDC